MEAPQLLQELIFLEEVLEGVVEGVQEVFEGGFECKCPRRPNVS